MFLKVKSYKTTRVSSDEETEAQGGSQKIPQICGLIDPAPVQSPPLVPASSPLGDPPPLQRLVFGQQLVPPHPPPPAPPGTLQVALADLRLRVRKIKLRKDKHYFQSALQD